MMLLLYNFLGHRLTQMNTDFQSIGDLFSKKLKFLSVQSVFIRVPLEKNHFFRASVTGSDTPG